MKSRRVKAKAKAAGKSSADPNTRMVSAQMLGRIKQKSQERDRALVASGEQRSESMHAISSKDAKDASVLWPSDDLED